MSTELKAGCLHEGTFYPAEEGVAYGYWHESSCLDLLSSSYDFSAIPASAQPCMFTQSSIELLAPGVQPGFLFRGRFFRSTKEILLVSMLQPSLHSTGSAIARKKQCVICKQLSSDCLNVQGKEVCLPCLVHRLKTRSLYFEEKGEKVNWSAQVVFDAYEGVRRAGRGGEIPTQCPLPCDSQICCGRIEQVGKDYPAYGHIVGVLSLCAEESSCLYHSLCFKCANMYSNCPVCGKYIAYESPPSQCTKCKKSLCYGFAMPCECGEMPQPRKRPAWQ